MHSPILDWIEEARRSGAEILTGGELEGELIAPTVIANAGPELKVSCEEVFGPVCTVSAYDSLDEAFARASEDRPKALLDSPGRDGIPALPLSSAAGGAC